jgi:outer membrane protein assembly factor BamB
MGCICATGGALWNTEGKIAPQAKECWTVSGIAGDRIVLTFDGCTALVKDWDKDGKEMKALDMSTGAVRWTASDVAKGPPIVSPKGLALIFDGKSYMQNKVTGKPPDGDYKALDVNTGEVKWSASSVSSNNRQLLSFDGDSVLVRDWSKNSEMKALDVTTGAVKWTASNVSEDVPVMSFNSDTVLVKDSKQSKEMRALDMRTGAVRWTVSNVSSKCEPVVSPKGMVLVKDWNKNSLMKALDMTTGEEKWSASAVSNGSWGQFMMSRDGDTVLVKDWSENSKMIALDGVTGAIKWTAPKVSLIPQVMSFNGDTVLVLDWDEPECGNRAMKALDMSTGAVRWTIKGASNRRPVVSPNGLVLIRDSERQRQMMALDVTTGEVLFAEPDLGGFDNRSEWGRPVISLNGDSVLVRGNCGFVESSANMKVRALELRKENASESPKAEQHDLFLFLHTAFLEDIERNIVREGGGAV